jgi:Phage integrase family
MPTVTQPCHQPSLAQGSPEARVSPLLLAQGVDQRVVMAILGHSQISMTSKYTHVLPEVMTDAA